MSPDEARDVQTILRSLLLEEHRPEDPEFEAAVDEARAAAVRLADATASLLGAGLTGAETGHLWGDAAVPA